MVYCCANIVVGRPAVATTIIDNVAAAAINITAVLIFVPKVELCNRLVVYIHSIILEKSDEKFVQNRSSMFPSFFPCFHLFPLYFTLLPLEVTFTNQVESQPDNFLAIRHES